MREILFKAKGQTDEKWHIGFLANMYGGICIIRENEHEWICQSDNICQYTGLTDKNGNKIFENDVLKIARTSDSIGEYYYPPLDYPVNVVVKWDLCAWMWETIEKRKHYISFPDAWCHFEAEVIGNIFDTPELLKEGTE